MEKVEIARKFCSEVKALADKYNLSFFLVTEGASITKNNGCEAIKNARSAHKEWERCHGFDLEETWQWEENNRTGKEILEVK